MKEKLNKKIVYIYIFLINFGIEIIIMVFNLRQYSFIGSIQYIIDNLHNTSGELLLVKLASWTIIWIFSLILNFYLYISFFNNYNYSFRQFFRSMWIKYLLTIIIISVPAKIIIEILNNNISINGFIDYLFIFTLIIVYYILLFIRLTYIAFSEYFPIAKQYKKYYAHLFLRLLFIAALVIIVDSPVSYYLGQLNANLHQYSVIIDFANILNKALYISFFIVAISKLFNKVMKEDGSCS